MKPLILATGLGHLPSLPTHRNPGLELVYLLRGHLIWQAEGRRELVSAGSVYFTLPGQLHGSTEEFEPGHEWVYAILAPGRASVFDPRLRLGHSEARRLESLFRASRRHAFAGSPLLRETLLALHASHARTGSLDAGRTASLARLALFELAACVQADASIPRPAVHGAAEGRVRGLLRRITEHPEEPWRLAGLAAECRLGRSRFSDLVRSLTGDSPIGFILRMRIRKARGLLRTTGWPVTRIAQECGFSTSQYFASVFRRFSGGLSASTYRKSR